MERERLRIKGHNHGRLFLLSFFCLVGWNVFALGGQPAAPETSKGLREGAIAFLDSEANIFVEIAPLAGQSFDAAAKNYLSKSEKWASYLDRQKLKIPLAALNDQQKLAVIKLLFPQDVYDEKENGWVHRIVFAGPKVSETLWRVAEWFTGDGSNYSKLMNRTKLRNPTIVKGQKIIIPREVLQQAFIHQPENQDRYVRTTDDSGLLAFKRDQEGDYASYVFKEGDTIYGSVVTRFTGLLDGDDIREAVQQIQKRSGIADVTKMTVGQEIKIPLELLEVKYRPSTDSEKRRYEQNELKLKEVTRVAKSEDLKGVTVILDAGHGGKDPGVEGAVPGMFEDEYSYDIMCRAKKLLEETTQAKVVPLVLDKSDGYKPKDKRDLTDPSKGADEVVLTTPPYSLDDPKVGVSMRWSLCNAIFKRVAKKKSDEEKVVFTSFHLDNLGPYARGTMVYYPSRVYADGKRSLKDGVYLLRAEAREQPVVQLSDQERLRSEKLSRDFADCIINNLLRHNPKITVHADRPVRGYIVQGGWKIYVPAVIRYNYVPVKILVEVANLKNMDDCEEVRDPQFRTAFAEAYVNALKEYYSN